MFKQWSSLVGAGALALLLTSAGTGRAQNVFYPSSPVVPIPPYSSYGNRYSSYVSPAAWSMWAYPSYATFAVDHRPYFGSLTPTAYGVPSSVAAMPFSYIAYYPPVFTTRAPTAAPAAGITSPDQAANVTVTVPADAIIWFDGQRTAQTGPQRFFTTPVLEEGKGYHYEVKARWMKDGQPVEQTQRVGVSAGTNVSVVFPMPTK
jgi:uncharacterized protein (TIGR03000 family)